MQLSPNEDEARAAKYNAACVHAQQKEWQKAVNCLKEAVNAYNLKAKVILEVSVVVVGVAAITTCTTVMHRYFSEFLCVLICSSGAG